MLRKKEEPLEQQNHMRGRGLAVDYYGGPTIDPTENVKDLSKALSERQDDLREINNLYILQRVIAVEEVAKIRAAHAVELATLEANRRDNVRQVDIQNAYRSEERAGEAIKGLTAALEQRFFDTNKRISALELSFSEGRGKQLVEDPRLERIYQVVENLSYGRQNDSGKVEGFTAMWKMIIAAVGLLVALNALGVIDRLKATPATVPVTYTVPAVPTAPAH